VAGILQFTPWLAYFANVILAELEALEKRQSRRRASPATALRAHHRAILDYVDEHGFITDKEYSQLTDRAKATRSLDFKKLMELDLLVREGKGRGTFYRRKM
jgi:Fic family protein